MTGRDLRRIRRRLGMTRSAFGRALGLGGDGAEDTLVRKISRLEGRDDELSARVSLAALRLEALADKKRRANL